MYYIDQYYYFFRVTLRCKQGGDEFLCFTLTTLDNDDIPEVTCSLNIYQDLSFKAVVQRVCLNAKNFDFLLKQKNKILHISEVENVLARLKNWEIEPSNTLEHCADLLENFETNELENESRLVAQFCSEQLRLVLKHPNARRYSSRLFGHCALWDRMSPKLYSHLYNNKFLVLPHPKVCREKSNALNVSTGFNEVTRKYFEMRCGKLSEREKLVHLSMDEVHVSESLELISGTFYGEEEGKTAKKIFALHISSIAGNYRDLLSLNPVIQTNKAFIDTMFNKALEELTQIGFLIVSVSTDNHKSNQAWHNSLSNGDDQLRHFSNPFQLAHSISTFYDSTHVYKNLYYSLLNRKVLKLKNFPWVEASNLTLI